MSLHNINNDIVNDVINNDDDVNEKNNNINNDANVGDDANNCKNDDDESNINVIDVKHPALREQVITNYSNDSDDEEEKREDEKF